MVKKVKAATTSPKVKPEKAEKKTSKSDEKVAEQSKVIKKDKKQKQKTQKQLQNGLKAKKNEEPTTATTTAAKKETPTATVVAKEKTPESIEKKKAKKLAQKEKKLLLKLKSSKASTGKDKPKGPTSKKGKDGKKFNKKDGKAKEPRPRNPEADASTIFVGNLPITTKRIQLVKLFTNYGPISTIRLRTAAGQAIFKHKQRKEAGSLNAYLLLKNPETAQKALEMNGTEFKDRHIRVTMSDSKTVKDNEVDAKRTIFVGNLKYSANEESLREIFSSCGEIESVRCIRVEKGCAGVAFVLFKSPEAVGLALELKDTLLDDRPIHVERYSAQKMGGKEARENAEKAAAAKTNTGAVRRIGGAKPKKPNGNISNGRTKPNAKSDEKKGKKEKYSGVKVNAINKKKNQTKKTPGQMKELAKKIAPLKATS